MSYLLFSHFGSHFLCNLLQVEEDLVKNLEENSQNCFGAWTTMTEESHLWALSLLTSEEQIKCIYEPRCEKTGLRGFRPGPTQNGLYSHRIWLEA